VIPIAVVEELDKFKKGNDTLAYNARGFMREINALTDRREFGPEGISLGEGLGTIRIVPNHPFPEELRDMFADDIQDHRILATAMWIRDTNPDRWRRYVQAQAVSVLIDAWNSGTTVESRPYVTQALQLIQQRVHQAGGDAATRAHYKDIDMRIKLAFEK
jgi:predicted ribonuclease YlaK